MSNYYYNVIKILIDNNKLSVYVHESDLQKIIKENSDMCKVNYKCFDKSGCAYIHKNKVIDNEYFNNVFELSDINELNLEFNFSEESLLFVLDIFYKKEKKCVTIFESIYDITKALLFFDMEEEIINLITTYRDNENMFTVNNIILLEELLSSQNLENIFIDNFIGTFPENLTKKYKEFPEHLYTKYCNYAVYVKNKDITLLRTPIKIINYKLLNLNRENVRFMCDYQHHSTVHFNSSSKVIYIAPTHPIYKCISSKLSNNLIEVYLKVNDKFKIVGKFVAKKSDIFRGTMLVDIGISLNDSDNIFVRAV